MEYFLTWHTYATWLPGDERGWDSRKQNEHDTSRPAPSRGLVSFSRRVQAGEAFVMTDEQRGIVDDTIREACAFRDWYVHALSVRTNHVHLVCRSPAKPMEVVRVCKARATRALRAAGVQQERVWARHASTRLLTTEPSFTRAIHYTLHEQ